MNKKLYRSRTDSVVAGVCGGLGEYLDVDPFVIRLVVFILFFFGMSIWLYIIAWIFVPLRPKMLREEDLRHKRVYDEFDDSDW